MKTNFEKIVNALLTKLLKFEYRIESVDHLWDIIFRDKKSKYHHIRIVKSYEIFYLIDIAGKLCTLEIKRNESVRIASSGFNSYEDNDLSKIWGDFITSACEWLDFVKKDWIKAAKEIYESYPLNHRYGIVQNSIIRFSLPELYQIDKELGKARTKKFICLVEEGYFHTAKNTIRETMTANDYFEYCRIAYLAGKRKNEHIDKSLTGREMYKCYADGRHEGLLEINPNSTTEFADWIDDKHPKRSRGGHPWEIKRGGNTTHIDLSISRPSYNDTNFTVSLRGGSISRLKETICMFLAVHEAGLPISIDDPEGIRKRLLAQDNIGIFPSYNSLHRADQHFHEHDDVYDVLYFDDLGRYKRRITPFIVWEPLPILKPVKW